MIALGAFELETLIGRGGASEVWRGRHRASGTPVAIKIAHPPRHEDHERPCTFYEEALRMTGLTHPGIIQIYDYGRVPPQVAASTEGLLQAKSAYLVMELAAAGLHHYAGELTWPMLYRLQRALLDALAYIHARGILHCDIKPGNLLIARDLRRIKLSDFGISCRLSELSTRYDHRTMLGTPSYMSPEQFNRNWRDYGPWTDLYAVGCTAMELATGAPPFGHRQHLEEIKHAHLFEMPPSLPARLELPKGYQEWLHRLLAKDPADRFQCAADASWALQQLEPETRDDAEENTAEEAAYFSPLLGSQSGEELRFPPTLIETQPIHTFSTTSIPVTEDPPSSPDTDPQTTTTPELPAVLAMPSSFSWELPPFPARWPEEHLEEDVCALLSPALAQYREPPLHGRELEQATLWETLRQTCEDRTPHLVMLAGSEGTGKTRLARWLYRCAHQAGVATPLHAAHQQEPGPNHGMVPMLKQFLHCHGLHGSALMFQISTRMSVTQPCANPLDLTQQTRTLRTIPWDAMIQWLEAPTLTPPPSLLQFLANLCEQRPILLWLDDAQWAPHSLQWCLQWLPSSSTSQLPIMLLLSYNPDQLSPQSPALPLLTQLKQLPVSRLLELTPPRSKAPDTTPITILPSNSSTQ